MLMLHVVIAAHPKHDSFNHALVEAYCEAVRAHGDDVLVRDLYWMGFDPCLKASELPTDEGATACLDVEVERARIAAAGVFVFAYPFWFNMPPAILKGYVDRVFGPGFGYDFAVRGTTPALGGRRLLSLTTSGAPLEWVQQTGAYEALMTLFDFHVCRVTGMRFAGHVHVGDVTPGLRQDAAEAMLAKAVSEAVNVVLPKPARARV
jgi:NAD(P)H dehydrogenase (quinone)